MERISLKEVPWNEVDFHGRLWTDPLRNAQEKGEMKMGELMSFSEIQRRYENKEDPFDLTMEKWLRIRQFAGTAQTLRDFQQLLDASNVAVPFCFEYQGKDCVGCPLESLCGPGRGEQLLKVMKLIQTHYLAILAGNTVPKERLVEEIEELMGQLGTLNPLKQ
jgi:hypothetical protein